jgi:hypothetical protein
MVALLQDKLVDMYQAWDMAEAKLPVLVDKVGVRRREEVKWQSAALVEELTLQQIRGFELCLAIVSPLKQGPMPEGMRVAATCHTEMVRQLAMLRGAVSSDF